MGEFPNKATQFSSTNQPAPHKKTHGLQLKTLIRKILEEEIVDDHGNKTVRAIIGLKAIVDKMEAGDVSAFKALSERLEGMPKQEIDNTHNFQTMPTVEIDGKEVEYKVGD